MKVTGKLNRNTAYDNQPEGTSRYAQNMVITNQGIVQNEDGLSRDEVYELMNIKVGGIVEFDDATVVFHNNNDESDESAAILTVFEDGTTRTKQIYGWCSLDTFSYGTVRNSENHRVITYIDGLSNVRIIDIDEDIEITPAADDEYKGFRNELTPPIYNTPDITVDVTDNGQLKTGRYSVVLGYGMSPTLMLKYTTPQGPYVVASHEEDESMLHTGGVTANSSSALDISFNTANDKFQYVTLIIIEELNSVVTTNVIARYETIDMEVSYTHASNTASIDTTSIDAVTIPLIDINNAKTITNIDNRSYIGGVKSTDYEPLDVQLQDVANNVKVLFNFKTLPEYTQSPQNLIYTADDVKTLPNTLGVTQSQGVQPDEVYAMYMNVVFPDGSVRQYHVPGREAKTIVFTYNVYDSTGFILQGTNTFNGLESDVLPSDYPMFTGVSNAGRPIFNSSKSLRVFHLIYNTRFDSVPGTDGDACQGGYWQNEDEVYPDVDLYGDLRNTPIRHHRTPTSASVMNIGALRSTSGTMNTAIPYPMFTDIDIPADIKSSITSIYFSSAKRTSANCTNLGDSVILPDKADDDGGSERDIFENTGTTVATKLRCYNYNLLANKPELNNIVLQPILEFNFANADTYTTNISSFLYDDSENEPIEASWGHPIRAYQYIPEGNTAAIPKNVYLINDETILNREEYLQLKTDFEFFMWTNIGYPLSTGTTANILLCNIRNDNVNPYTPFYKQDTYIMTDSIDVEDITSSTYIIGHGDVFLGIEHNNLKFLHGQDKYSSNTWEEEASKIIRWIGYSPVLHQSRVVENNDYGKQTYEYNKSCTPINDIHNPIMVDGLQLLDYDIYNRTHDILRSDVQSTENAALSIRVFRANSYQTIPRTKGAIVNLIAQNKTLLAQTTDTTWVYKLKDSFKTDNVNAYLGDGDFFTSAPSELILNTLGVGGNSQVNSHLIFTGGIMFPDKVSGEMFLITDKVSYTSQQGLTADFKTYLSNSKYVHMAYDKSLERVIVSIIGATDDDPTIVLSYYHKYSAWVSHHTHIGTIPFNIDGVLKYHNPNYTHNDNSILAHDPLSPCIYAPTYSRIQLLMGDTSAIRQSYIDIPIISADNVSSKISAVYLNTTVLDLVNNHILKDQTIDEIMCYSDTKCTGVELLTDDVKAHITRGGGVLSLKHNVWRYNNIYDNLVRYFNESDNFINTITGEYDASAMSGHTAGGGRVTLPYYDRAPFIESYIIVRCIIDSTNSRKVSIKDISLSFSPLN